MFLASHVVSLVTSSPTVVSKLKDPCESIENEALRSRHCTSKVEVIF